MKKEKKKRTEIPRLPPTCDIAIFNKGAPENSHWRAQHHLFHHY